MSHDVILYSTPLCAPCESLKAFLREQGIRFTVKDLLLDEAAAARLEALNIRTTPALEIDGEILAGAVLNPEAILERLAPPPA